MIIVVEMDLPLLTTTVPPGMLGRGVNLNEILQFNITPDASQDPDQLRYAASILYDFDAKAVFRFEYLRLQFKIWDYFVDVAEKAELGVKLSAKDPYFYMPSISTVQLQINLPPAGGAMSILPSLGDALSTMFVFQLPGWSDSDLPIKYKFQLYLSSDIMHDDLIKGEDTNKVVLSDYQERPYLKTLLPSPSHFQNGTANTQIIVVVSLQDHLGGVRNLTRTLEVASVST
jgi:hypothetical protein